MKENKPAPHKSQLGLANGMTTGACARVAKFSFGKYVKQIEKNFSTWMFDVLVYESLPDEETGEEILFTDAYGKDFIKYWQEFWGGDKNKSMAGFNLVIYKGTNLSDALNNLD